MATKVKGNAIKEGSIPLSALSNEVKDKIENAGGGADWNAQEGEAGYIENRTHYEYTQIVQSIDEEYRIPIEVDLPLINDWDDIDPYYMHHYIKLKNDLVIYKPYKEDELYNKLFIPKGTLLGYLNDSGEIYDIQDCITDFSIGGFGMAETTIVKENNNWFIKHYNDDYSEDIIIRTELKNIDEKYLPNTVLKTTPQTLSDADKNQTLANLGIENYFRQIKDKCTLHIQYYELSFDSENPNLATGYSTGLDNLIKDIKSFISNCYYYNEIGQLITEWGKFTCTEMYCNNLNDVHNATDIAISFGTPIFGGANFSSQIQIRYENDELLLFYFEI